VKYFFIRGEPIFVDFVDQTTAEIKNPTESNVFFYLT